MDCRADNHKVNNNGEIPMTGMHVDCLSPPAYLGRGRPHLPRLRDGRGMAEAEREAGAVRAKVPPSGAG